MPPLRPSYSTATMQQPVSVSPCASSAPGWGSYSYQSNAPAGPDYFYPGSSRDSDYHEPSNNRNVRARLSAPTPDSHPPRSPSHQSSHHHPQHHHPYSYSHTPSRQHPSPSSMAADGPSRRARSSSSQSQDGDEGASPTQGSKGRSGGQGPRTIQSKACVNCRRSKVKCVNDGSGGPCRRCIDVKLDCKWRVRIDDEAWRESVERRFAQLSSQVNAIASTPPASGRRSDCAPSPAASGEVYQHPEWRNLHNKPGAMLPPPTTSAGRQLASAPSPSYPSFSGSTHRTSPRSDVGSSASTAFNAPSPRDRLPPPAMLISGADVTMTNGDYSGWTPGGRPRSISSVKMDSSLASPSVAGRDQKVTSPLPDIARGFTSSQSHGSSSLSSTGQGPSMAHRGSAPQVLQDTVRQTNTMKLHGPPVQWDAGSYASAVSSVGQDDPRLNLIGTGALPCARVTKLFVYFGKYMQSHSFGFPTFAPNEQMTPLITNSISLAASFFDPGGRRYSHAIKKLIAEQVNLAEADSLREEQHLDRELGVGVEEITGLCIAASWMSGEDGDRLAKFARYWALAYLRQFEARMDPQSSPADREKTWSEKMTMQPAYRVIDKSLRLRIWLESYIVDAAASIMNGRELFAPGKTAMPICEELRDGLSNAQGGRNSPTRSELSSEDIQLLGHASILDIFIAARALISTSRDSEKTMRELRHLMEEDLEIWRERTSRDTDLALNTPVAVDLGLTYYLARAYIGSLALSLNVTSGSPRSPHSPPPSTPSSRMQHNIVTQAKDSALMALQTAQDNLSERLLTLPTWQHFLLCQAGGFLLRLLPDAKWFVTSQSHQVLTSVECYSRLARNHLDMHRAQTPYPSSSSSTTSPGALHSSPSYGSAGATASASASATKMTARDSSASSSSSQTAVEPITGARAGAPAAAVGKNETGGEQEEAKHAPAAAAAAAATPGGEVGEAHPAAAMIEELYWGAMRMRGLLME